MTEDQAKRWCNVKERVLCMCADVQRKRKRVQDREEEERAGGTKRLRLLETILAGMTRASESQLEEMVQLLSRQ
jgi:hypothetical protein